MTIQRTDALVKDELDRLTANFFRAVTFEAGDAPPYDSIYALFIESGLLIKNTGATPEISTVREFIEPRAAMVRAGELTRFREVELSETTVVFGNVAHRFSAYAKSGSNWSNCSSFSLSNALNISFISNAPPTCNSSFMCIL